MIHSEVTAYQSTCMVRVLTSEDVASLLNIEDVLPVVEDALIAQSRGAVERPERPHYDFGVGLDPDLPNEPTGTGLCMPAYVHGNDYTATKLVAVCESNRDRGLPTIHAQIALTDARDGRPVAYMAGTHLTNVRTGCIGGLAAREFAPDGPVTLAVIGAGTQARWQTRAIAATTDLKSVRVYSPSESRFDCASDLDDELACHVEAVSDSRSAVDGASVVLTATTATEPVFPGETLTDGTLVIAVGAYTPETRELDDVTIERADRIVADVPEEARETGDLRHHSGVDILEFGALLDNGDGRRNPAERIVLASVGTAVLDAAVAEFVLRAAEGLGAGTEVSL